MGFCQGSRQTTCLAGRGTAGRLQGIVKLLGYDRIGVCDRAGHTGRYARAATPVTSAHVWKALGPGGSIVRGGKVIAAEVEEVVDLVVGGEETLSLLG
jgi:hypothetical protein